MQEGRKQRVLGTRLAQARVQIGVSLAQFGRMTGIPVSSLKKYERGSSVPGGMALRAMAGAGINLNWLLTGEGPMLQSGEDGSGDNGRGGSHSVLPSHPLATGTSKRATPGADQIPDALAFKRDWLRHAFRTEPGDLCTCRVNSESMEPTLRSGSIILVDRRIDRLGCDDGIYALTMKDHLLIRRVQRQPQHRAILTSDNPVYESFDVALDDPPECLCVIGRVIWAGYTL